MKLKKSPIIGAYICLGLVALALLGHDYVSHDDKFVPDLVLPAEVRLHAFGAEQVQEETLAREKGEAEETASWRAGTLAAH